MNPAPRTDQPAPQDAGNAGTVRGVCRPRAVPVPAMAPPVRHLSRCYRRRFGCNRPGPEPARIGAQPGYLR